MPRALSSNALRALMAEATDEVFIILLTFEHEPTNEIYRCALNTENIVSRANTYTATYFEVELPESSSSGYSGCKLVVDNVDLMLVSLLRSITEPLKVTIEVVLASQPNTVELELTDLILREATWDASVVTGTLLSDDPLNQKFPGHIYEPRVYAGIF